MKPAPFSYHAPTELAGVVELLSRCDDAKVLAGGQSLIPLLSMRLAVISNIIDLRRVEELRGITRSDAHVWIGAATTQADAEVHPVVAASVPLLARALPLIGHFQVRNRGTIGGSLAHADPASEIPAVALALEAELDVLSVHGRRTIPAAEFFTGTWSTALADDEVLVGSRFPVWTGRCGFAVEEIARRHGDFAIAGACVGVEIDDDTRITRCTIGMFGLGPTPLRATAAEHASTGQLARDITAAEVGTLAVADLTSVPADLHGSAAYRRRVGATVVARAWMTALEEATNG